MIFWVFGTLSVTFLIIFSDASVTFFVTFFCQTPFAGLLLRQGDFFFYQGKTSWVDSACADCPGFLVLRAAPAPASTFASEPQIVPWASISLHGPLDICLDLLPAAPRPPMKKLERGEKTPTPKISASLRKRPVLLRPIKFRPY